MPFRNWLSYAAIAGLIVVVCLGSYLSPRITGFIPRQGDGIANVQNAASQQQDTNQTPQNKKSPPTAEYKDPCSDGEKSDLCAQLRMADAAEFQSGLNVAGVLLLTLSLFFTAWAAVEASKGASAAERGVEISQASVVASERPWLTVEATIASSLRFINGQGLISVDFTIQNLGKTPAVEVLVYAKIVPWYFDAFDSLRREFAETLEQRRKGPAKLGRVVFPSQPINFPHHLNIWPKQIAQITKEGKNPLIAPDILGCVAYVNPATNEQHETGFVFHLRGSKHGGNSIDTREAQTDELILLRAIVGGYVT